MKRSLLLGLVLAACGRPVIPLPDRQPPVQQQPLVGCDGKSLIALERRTLVRIDASGTTPLFTFGEGLAETDVGVNRWQLAGNVIGGAAYISRGTGVTYEYVLVDLSGKVLFHKQSVEQFTPTIFLGDDGSLAVAAHDSFIARPDGTVTPLGDFMPMTPVLATGDVIVARGPAWQPTSEKLRWHAGEVEPLKVPMGDSVEVHVVGGRAVYIASGNYLAFLDGQTIALPASAVQLADTAAGRYMLFGNGNADAWTLVDLETRTARPLGQVPETRDHYSSWGLSLTPEGDVLAASEADETLQLRRGADLGKAWSDLGEPMKKGMDFGLGAWVFSRSRGSGVLAASMTTGYGHYIHDVQLVYGGASQHFDARGLYVNVDLNPGAVDLSADGQCVATWSHENPEANPLDGPFTLELMGADGKHATLETAERMAFFVFSP